MKPQQSFARALVPFIAIAIAAISPLSAQTASLSGTVRDSSDRPLANAELLFRDGKNSTRSDDSGKFVLTRIQPGTHSIVVRMVGYESFAADIKFTASQKVEADFLLNQYSAKLSKVTIKATKPEFMSPRLAEFEERRLSHGAGRFFTAEVFEKAQGSLLTDIFLGRIPGLRRVNLPHTSLRPLAGRPISKYNCFIQIVVNGIMVYKADPGLPPTANSNAGDSFYDIDLLTTANVIGAEYYSPSATPPRYNATGASPCGTLLIWTKD